jgi:signal transduction histidine kinase
VKLLNRTVRHYVFISSLLLVVSTPVFYFTIRHVFTQEIDEELVHHQNEFRKASHLLTTPEAMTFFRAMNKEFVLETGTPPQHDSIFTMEKYDSVRKALIPFRVLATEININDTTKRLEIRESLVSSKDLILIVVLIQVALGLLMLAGLILINRRLTRVIWNPFYKILDQLKRYEINKDSVLDLPNSSTAEFRDLGTVIAQLVSKNKAVYESQRDFTANASHEIQTPLAILNGKVDLLMQTDLTEHQAKLIEDIQHCIGRLVRLNKALLLLARIENGQFPDRERVTLDSVIKHQIIQNESQIRKNSLLIQYTSPEGELSIMSNQTLIEILISNLISNAIRFTQPNSTIRIVLTLSSLTIINPGNPLSDRKSIFDRFKREHTSIPGSGLGLAIAKKICEQEGFKLQYSYDNGLHEFKVSDLNHG